jgi:hypothetical protein
MEIDPVLEVKSVPVLCEHATSGERPQLSSINYFDTNVMRPIPTLLLASNVYIAAG